MSTSTIARQQERPLPTPQDPWLGTADTEYQPNAGFNGQQLDGAFHNIIATNFPEAAPIPRAIGDAAVTEVIHAPEPKAAPSRRPTIEHEHIPISAAEIARREQAGMIATFALAHSLRDTNPELLRGVEAAFSDQPTATIVEPETRVIKRPVEIEPSRPAKYKGRRRR